MPSGTLGGMAISQHVPTPAPHAARIRNLIQLPASQVAIGDLAGCGAGNLLFPFRGESQVRLFGIEISADRADLARSRLPGAVIIRAPFEATRPTPGAFSLCVTNPPYVKLDDGRRAEYAAQALCTRALAPGGVNIAIIPARSGLDGALINHWARNFERVRCWKFPSGSPEDDRAFEKYTQIVLAGVKRAAPLTEPDPEIRARIQGWRYDADHGWFGGVAPPDLPDTMISDPYVLPPMRVEPEIVVVHADESALLEGLAASGVHHSPVWREAVTLTPAGMLPPPLMPPTGPAHLAALVLSGLLDGEIISGPDGRSFVVTTATTKQATPVEIDDDLLKKGVVEINQIEDVPVLGVLDLETGAPQVFQGSEAYAFLQPLLPTLAAQVLERHQPRYTLNPEEWELRVALGVGLDKQLPGADHPGLAPAQLHRVFALRRALWDSSRAMFQGEPGVGKTRQIIALIAVMAQYWRERDSAFFRRMPRPRWARRLLKAWKANPRAPGRAPRALPVWISPPKRVIPTWRREIAGAFPDAEVLVIRDHTDVARWMNRCAESSAPAVIALVSHSTKSATGVRWRPAVQARRGGAFMCPDCGRPVEDVPRGAKKAKESDEDLEDLLELVTSFAYFEKKPRRCRRCGGALWSVAKTEPREEKYPHTPFAVWSRAARTMIGREAGLAPVRIQPDGSAGPVCPDSFSPYRYMYRMYRGCAALAIIDESHNGRGAATDIAQAHHDMMLASQCRVLASGTHTGGELRHLFHYVFRYHPQFWLRLGLGWKDVDEAVRRFGVVEQRITEHESDARRGSGLVDRAVSLIEVPGISATLLPYFLGEMVYISVMDVGSYMPPLVEIPWLVEMRDPALDEPVIEARDALRAAQNGLAAAREAEAPEDEIERWRETLVLAQSRLAAAEAWRAERDLAQAYARLMRELGDLAEKRNQAAMLAKGSIPRWWSVLPMVNPPFTVTQTLRNQWGEEIGSETLITAPVLVTDHEYPLERAVREIVAAERAQNRRVLLYVEQNQERVTAIRYAAVLADFEPWTLPRLDPELREDAIREAVARGHTVVLAPYTHVSEGLNLQGEFETIVWVELAQSHFLRDQASRRIWRLGKVFPQDIPEDAREVRVYYLAYAGTAAHSKLDRLGKQNGAAMLFAGDTPDGELAKRAGADRASLARLSRDLEAVGDEAVEEDLASSFARRNAERMKTLRGGRPWIGVVDDLPARLASLRASLAVPSAPAPVEEAAPEPVPAAPEAPAPAPVEEAAPEPVPAAPEAPAPAPVEPVQLPLFGSPPLDRNRRKPPPKNPEREGEVVQLALW